MITSGWRSRLQARHGSGGRGVLAAGRPYAGYLTWGVTASQSGGWSVNATFGGRYREGGPPLGISGFTQTAQRGRRDARRHRRFARPEFRPHHRLRDRPARRRHASPCSMGDEERTLEPRCAAPAAGLPDVDSDSPVSSASVTTEDDGVGQHHLVRHLPAARRRRPLQSRRGRRPAHPFRPHRRRRRPRRARRLPARSDRARLRHQ